jgi:hypothetical protein
MISFSLSDTINVLPTDTTNAFCSSDANPTRIKYPTGLNLNYYDYLLVTSSIKTEFKINIILMRLII